VTDWDEATIGETLTFLLLPRQHHKHLTSTNLLERLNEEIERRTRVVCIGHSSPSCLRLVRALCAETHAARLADDRSINRQLLKGQKKAGMKLAARSAQPQTVIAVAHNLADTTSRAACLLAQIGS
jgi:transposase-like protein